jgi:hypothetical protein
VRILRIAVLSLATLSAQQKTAERSVQLTNEQKAVLQELQATSTAKAAAGMTRLAGLAREFNRNLPCEKPDPELDRHLAREMGVAFAGIIEARAARIFEELIEKTLTLH